jgi:hypothetical protein
MHKCAWSNNSEMLCDNFGLFLSLNFWSAIYYMKIKCCINVWMCTKQRMIEDTKISVAKSTKVWG